MSWTAAPLDATQPSTRREDRYANAKRPFGYVWLEAGAQPQLEKQLLQGNTFQQRFTPLVGQFTPESLTQFMRTRCRDGPSRRS